MTLGQPIRVTEPDCDPLSRIPLDLLMTCPGRWCTVPGAHREA